MQVELLAKDSLHFLLDFLKLHRSSKHQDPTHVKNKKSRRHADYEKFVPAAKETYTHTFRQNPHKLLFLVCADSSKCTLHICGSCWQPDTNHSPFPFHSPAHIPVWIKCVCVCVHVCLTRRCALSHELEHVTRTACLSECVYVSVWVYARSHSCMYAEHPHSHTHMRT